MKQISLRHTLMVFLCLLLAGLTLSGCDAFGTQKPTDPMTLRVGQNTNAGCFFPLYVAVQKQFFKAQGLTLSPPVPPTMGSGPGVSAAIESGRIDIAGGGVITDAFTLARIDWQVRLLGVLSDGFVNDIIVSKQFEQQAHLSMTSSLEDKVKALVGKRIGTTGTGTGTESLVIYLFRIFGFDAQRDAKLINIGNTNNAPLTALKSGRVDAVSFFPPAGQEATLQHVGDIFISPGAGDVPAMRGQIHCLFYARKSVIDAKPKAVEAFIRAIAQAESFIHKSPDQAIVLLQKDLKLDAKTIKPVFTAVVRDIPDSPQITRQGYEAANQYHVKAGLIAIALPYEDMVATDIINDALNGMSSSS